MSDDGDFYDRIPNLNQKNMAVAAFVTAWGRLTLWEEMNRLGERVIYHDTDSIVYEHVPGEYNTPIGRYLGCWECETGGDPIKSFVSIGPKTYAYKVARTQPWPDAETLERYRQEQVEYVVKVPQESIYVLEPHCKAKGFHLKGRNAEIIHFNALRSLLLKEVNSIRSSSMKFVYRRQEREMITREEEKSLMYTYTKGLVDKTTYTVYPFGSLQWRPELAETVY